MERPGESSEKSFNDGNNKQSRLLMSSDGEQEDKVTFKHHVGLLWQEPGFSHNQERGFASSKTSFAGGFLPSLVRPQIIHCVF